MACTLELRVVVPPLGLNDWNEGKFYQYRAWGAPGVLEPCTALSAAAPSDIEFEEPRFSSLPRERSELTEHRAKYSVFKAVGSSVQSYM